MFVRGGKDKKKSNLQPIIIKTKCINLAQNAQKNYKKCGVEYSAAKRGLVDHELEMFNVDHIKPGNAKKALFVL